MSKPDAINSDSNDTVDQDKTQGVNYANALKGLLDRREDFPPNAKYVMLRSPADIEAHLPEMLPTFKKAQEIADEGNLDALLQHYLSETDNMVYQIVRYSIMNRVPSVTIELPLPAVYAQVTELQIGIAFPHSSSAVSIKEGISYAAQRQRQQLIGMLIIVTNLPNFLKAQAGLLSRAPDVARAISTGGVKLTSVFIQSSPNILTRSDINTSHPVLHLFNSIAGKVLDMVTTQDQGERMQEIKRRLVARLPKES